MADKKQNEPIVIKVFETCTGGAKISLPEAHISCLDQLITVCKQEKRDCDLATALLAKLQVLWLTGANHRELIDLGEKAVSLLERASKKVNGPVDGATLQDDLAQAYVWLYQVSHTVAQQMEAEDVAPDLAPSSPTAGETGAKEVGCCQWTGWRVGEENVAQGMLRKALSLWQALYDQYLVDSEPLSLRCPTTTLCTLSLVSALCGLANKVQLQVSSLWLLVGLSSILKKTQIELTARSRLLRLLSQLYQSVAMERLLESTETWLLSEPELKQTNQHAHFLLAKAEVLLINNKGGEFHSVLEEVSQIQHSTTKYKSMEWQLLEGQRAWLLSRCMAQLPDPACDTAEAQHSSNALELSLRSTKVMGGVVCHVLGEWIISPDAEPPVTKQNKRSSQSSAADRFENLGWLLNVLLYTGRLYVQVGEAREARCHLLQGAKIAEAFRLPCRYAEFQLALGQLDLPSGRFNDCEARLHRTQYVLAADVASGNTSITSRPGGDEENTSDESECEESFLKTCPIDMMVDLCEEPEGTVGENPASPKVKQSVVVIPKEWHHDESCMCEHCVDFCLQESLLKQLLITAALHAERQNLTEAHRALRAVLTHHANLNKRSLHTLQEVLQQICHRSTSTNTLCDLTACDTDGATLCDLPVYRQHLVDACLQLCRLALTQNDQSAFEKYSVKALSLLSESESMSAAGSMCVQQRAETFYLCGVRYLPAPTAPEPQVDVTDVVNKISQLSLAHIDSRSFMTPDKHPVRSRQKNAVLKKSLTQALINSRDISVEDSQTNEENKEVKQFKKGTKPALSKSRRDSSGNNEERSNTLEQNLSSHNLTSEEENQHAQIEKEAVKLEKTQKTKGRPKRGSKTFYDDNVSDTVISKVALSKTKLSVNVRQTKKSSVDDNNISVTDDMTPMEKKTIKATINRSKQKKVPASGGKLDILDTRRSCKKIISPQTPLDVDDVFMDTMPATPLHIKALVGNCTPQMSDTKTPRSVCSRRAVAAKLLDSDSEDSPPVLNMSQAQVERAPRKKDITRSKKSAISLVEKNKKSAACDKPATSLRVKALVGNCTPQMSHDTKTPRSVCSKRAVAAKLLDSDSENSPPVLNMSQAQVKRAPRKNVTRSKKSVVEKNEKSVACDKPPPESLSDDDYKLPVPVRKVGRGSSCRLLKSSADNSATVSTSSDVFDFDEFDTPGSTITKKKGKTSTRGREKSSKKVQNIQIEVPRHDHVLPRIHLFVEDEKENTSVKREEPVGIIRKCKNTHKVRNESACIDTTQPCRIPKMEKKTGMICKKSEVAKQPAPACNKPIPRDLARSRNTKIAGRTRGAVEIARGSHLEGSDNGSVTLSNLLCPISDNSFEVLNVSDDSIVEQDTKCDIDNLVDFGAVEDAKHPPPNMTCDLLVDTNPVPLPEIKILEEIEPIEILRGDTEDEESAPELTRRTKRNSSRSKLVTMGENKENREVLPSKSRQMTSIKVKGLQPKTNPAQTKSVAIEKSPESPGAEENLLRAFSILRHNPRSLVYHNVCQALALLNMRRATGTECTEINTEDQEVEHIWQALYYLSEGQAITFRHTLLVNIARKLSKIERLEKEHSEDKSRLTDTERTLHQEKHQLLAMQQYLSFNKTVQHVKEIAEFLPKDWVVVQVFVIQSVGWQEGQMVVTRLSHGEPPLIRTLPGYASTEGQNLLKEFQTVFRSSKETLSLTDKLEWWRRRASLDAKLKDTHTGLEEHWLAEWKALFLGQPLNPDDQDKLENMTDHVYSAIPEIPADKRAAVKVLVNCASLLTSRQLSTAIHQLSNGQASPQQLSDLCTHLLKSPVQCTDRQTVVLLLDKEVQHISWESFPVLRAHATCRLPSLHFLYSHLKVHSADELSVYTKGILSENTYYIVNPEANLPHTQDLFQNWFQKQKGWTGVSGRRPTSEQYVDALTKHDLFVYCGHGSGSKFLSGDSLQMLHCRAVTLLMGCSSGRLLTEGHLEPNGMMLQYFLAGCPSVLANLWDVTDRDIDRFLEELLKLWLASPPDTSLLDCVRRARDVCKLPYLIGSAPVVYGLPVRLAKSAGK